MTERRVPYWLEGRPMHKPAGWIIYDENGRAIRSEQNEVDHTPGVYRIGLERDGWDDAA
jgi:hypothetical protein